jgi:magnesium transporter
VGETIDFLRNADHLPDQFYHVILVDPRMKPQGYVSLGRLLAAARATQLRALAEDSYRTVRGATPEADVAYLFTQYHLISCPVVDADDRLVGVITIDDAMNVLDEEHEEDMLLLAGVGEESSISDGVFETVRQRFPWLFVNLLAANLSALVIAQFQSTIAVFLALAALLPIVASMGGNAGTQSLTVAVRALATRDLTATNAMRVVRREAAVGLINGMGFALMMALVGWYFYDSLALGGVIAVAMVVNLLIAALAGVLVPLIFVRFGMDPAVSSGTFVTTLTDLFGFFTFLGLASLVLM